ncbi:MAG: hypothetical protein K0V04_06690, partial [Deltaproteobacteria bacterium]|nr:hypothetical protein [Deltaproteobacteria bacterium]
MRCVAVVPIGLALTMLLVACPDPGAADTTTTAGLDGPTTTGTQPTSGTSVGPTDSGDATSTAGLDSTTADDGPATGNQIFDVGRFGDLPPRLPPVCTVSDNELDAVGPCDETAPPDSFEPDVQWSFPGVGGLTQCLTTPLVANLTDDNGDGNIDLCDIPDVVTVIGAGGETGPGTIVVLDGETGTVHFMINAQVQLGATPALGDIDNDGRVEIVAVTTSAQGSQLVVFEHDGTPKPFGPAVWP